MENENVWTIIVVQCSDGVERVGMFIEGALDVSEERVVHIELNKAEAEDLLISSAQHFKMSYFDNDADYEAIEN